MNQYLLSLLIFIPLLAAAIVVLLPKRLETLYKYVALVASLLQVVLGITLYGGFQAGKGSPVGINDESAFQFVEKLDWITLDLGRLGKLSVDYFLGVDGVSITMVLLSVIVLLVGVISSWNMTEKLKGYFGLYLLLNASIIGCFVALDFLLFYLFFEFMLLPMYFLIGIWGGPRKDYASIKFFLYTLLGSIFILIVMIGLYNSTIDPAATAVELSFVSDVSQVTPEIVSNIQGMLKQGRIAEQNLVHTFNMVHMTDMNNFIPDTFFAVIGKSVVGGLDARLIGFLLLFVGFAIKVPVVPVHTWLPDAHVEAPTPISVILAGILLKIGGYGLIRTAYLIFPEGGVHYAWLVGLLGLISIIYGAMNALSSKDLKKLIAYSSVSHMGFVLLGLASLTSEGVGGAIYQMFSHGVISSMLFLIAGVLYDRTHDRMIENYSGLASKMPRFTAVVVIAFFASLGLPGFSGFIAEVLVFLGAFSSGMIPKWMAITATLGLLLSAAYYLWTIQRMFFGKFSVRFENWSASLTDLGSREYIMLVPLIVLTLLLGIFPHFILDMINASVSHLVTFVTNTGATINQFN
ncbi:MAG: NADH-quinone oxidoreductase subunit M [Bacteroidota bacterium]